MRKKTERENIGKKKTPGRVFAKAFAITLLVSVIIFTTVVTLGMGLLDKKPMDKNSLPDGSSGDMTSEKIDILIPAEGMFATEFVKSKRVNVLLLGNTDEELTDTIMLASFDPVSKNVSIISVPRDTYYDRPDKYGAWLKINAVFHDGVLESAKAVHNVLLGIPINYYAIVDYEGIKTIVDSMDGVPFNVPDRMYYTSRRQNLYIDLQPGKQILDGDKAVQFLRFRSGYRDGDVGRVKAQQKFVRAAIKRALGLKLPKVADTVVKNVDSDVSVRAILYMLNNSSGVEMSNVKTYILPGAPQTINGGSFYIRAEDPEIEKMLRKIYDPKPPKTSDSAVTPGATG